MNRRTLVVLFRVALALVCGIGMLSIYRAQRQHWGTTASEMRQLSQAAAISPNDQIREIISEVNEDRVVDDLRRFAGEEPICVDAGCRTVANRLTGSEGLGWALDYLHEDLASRGYSVEFRDWSLEGWHDRNLIARKVGVLAPSEEVYFVAHVDGVDSDTGEPSPAADDNASGAVDILEVARVLSSHSFSRTLVLFFSSGEEQGALGVRSYLDQLSRKELNPIKYAINVDMVGYDNNSDGVMELWHGDDPASLAVTQMMSQTINAYQLDLAPRVLAGCG